MLTSAALPPLDPSTRSWRRRAFALVGVMTLFRLAGAACTALTDTEGYYASWSRFLDWSYYDHPPMVAWMIWLTTRVSGSALAARTGPVLCAALAGLLLHRLASRLFSPRAAFLAVALHVAIPAYFFTALLANPEATLAPCWLFALLLVDDLRTHREPWRPIALGAAIGVAFLSKYTALLLGPVALLVLATTRTSRPWLRRPSLYVGGLVALAVAAPVWIWNARHDWPSIRLHLAERVAPVSWSGYAQHGIDAGVGQFVLFHPLIWPVLIATLVVMLMRARDDERYRFLACASVPVLAFFAVTMSSVRDAEPHWTMVGYLPAIIGAGALFDEQLERAPRTSASYAVTCALASLVLLGSTFAHARTDVFERMLPTLLYDGQGDAVHETLGWDALRSATDREAARLGPRTVVASAHNVFCGHLLVELDDRPRVYCPSPRRTQFDFEGRRSPPSDAPVLFIEASRDAERHEHALPDRDCVLVDRVAVLRGTFEAARYDLLACPPRRLASVPASERR